MLEKLRSTDPEVFSSILDEVNRQHSKLELIASENFTSEAVLEAMGTPLTNKYAEGYPAKRYYGGCEYVDVVETLAIERAKKLFGADHANVQPHSGSGANMASYFALVPPGSKIMGLDLAQGGHLTHGSPVNFSGHLYEFHSYGVSQETEQIDLDKFRKQVEEVKPALVVFGASAYPRTLDFAAMAETARNAGAKTMADIAHIAGLVAAGLHPSPVEYCDVVTTTTHKTLRGPRGGLILCKEQYTKDINKQIFPGSQGGPLMHVIAAKAVAFHEALQPAFKAYQQQIVDNAKAMEETFKQRDIRMIAGGTDTHLILLDVGHNGLTGKASEHALDEAWLTCNKNMIPYDKEKPFVTSGIRIGTPALTSRGMGVDEMKVVANCIADILESKLDEGVIKTVQGKVQELTQAFPLYPSWLSLVEQNKAVTA